MLFVFCCFFLVSCVCVTLILRIGFLLGKKHNGKWLVGFERCFGKAVVDFWENCWPEWKPVTTSCTSRAGKLQLLLDPLAVEEGKRMWEWKAECSGWTHWYSRVRGARTPLWARQCAVALDWVKQRIFVWGHKLSAWTIPENKGEKRNVMVLEPASNYQDMKGCSKERSILGSKLGWRLWSPWSVNGERFFVKGEKDVFMLML